MEWLGSNWTWLALGAGFIAFLALGRGGCAMGHGGHSHQDATPGDRPRETGAADQASLGSAHAGHAGAPSEAGGRRHRHGCC